MMTQDDPIKQTNSPSVSTQGLGQTADETWLLRMTKRPTFVRASDRADEHGDEQNYIPRILAITVLSNTCQAVCEAKLQKGMKLVTENTLDTK